MGQVEVDGERRSLKLLSSSAYFLIFLKANSGLTMCQQSDRTVMTTVGYIALGKIILRVHLGPIKYVDEDIAECQFRIALVT